MTFAALLTMLFYGLTLGAIWFSVSRYLRPESSVPGETEQQRLLDEIDQLDVQIRIFNERLKRVEYGLFLRPGQGDGRGETDLDTEGGGRR